MATTYNELITKVRNWSNRDSEVLNDEIINDCLEYAADDAYRILRIPPLEAIQSYTTTAEGRVLDIPIDLSTFIQLREVVDENFLGSRLGTSPYCIYKEKSDIRSFYDVETNKQDYYRWTRQANQIHVYPNYRTGATFELYYYRRLPPLNSVYTVNVANAFGIDPTMIGDTNGFLTVADTPMEGEPAGDRCPLYYTEDITDPANPVYTYYQTMEDVPEDESGMEVYFTGNESPNWLKDNHERTILYGALGYVFAYLQELEQAQIYKALFTEELNKLNSEENKRKYDGGNSVINFSTGGLI